MNKTIWETPSLEVLSIEETQYNPGLLIDGLIDIGTAS